MCHPDVPPRLSLCGMMALAKKLFNPWENGCHSGLAQKWAKPDCEQKQNQKQTKRGFHEILLLSAEVGLWLGVREGRASRVCVEADRVLVWGPLAVLLTTISSLWA